MSSFKYFKWCFLVIFLPLVFTTSDYYELLGIKKDATVREIRQAFKKLALTKHPDKNPNDPEAHENFIKLNKVYEVLKDADKRKKYDAYGEKGLKDDFGSEWTGSFHSWNYYHESFGIYDDDPEIVTLSHSDFDRIVEGSSFVWFINFYSPQCSHCHTLAPNWRRLARELDGVIRIGAINCGEEWTLCRQLNVRSYPSLLLFPSEIRYQGTREIDDMVEFVLKNIHDPLIMLNQKSFEFQISAFEQENKPWLIYFCKNEKECWDWIDVKKIAIVLNGVINVAGLNCNEERELCTKLQHTESNWVLFKDLKPSGESSEMKVLTQEDRKDIVQFLFNSLPDIKQLNYDEYKKMRSELLLKATPWLLYFSKSPKDQTLAMDVKRLKSMASSVELAEVDCDENPDICDSLHLKKYPAFVLFKMGDSYEIFHGETSVYNLVTFVKETVESQVQTLEPQHFPGTVVHSQEPWFVDFFAPWCPPCMNLLPEWRKASKVIGHMINFGTVDCTVHSGLCSSYNIKSYPTTILFNKTVPHQFYGGHSAEDLVEFVEDTLHPSVVTLNPASFSSLVEEKTEHNIWAIDFYAPWCGPCQKLGPHWRKMAKGLASEPTIHVGQVDCQEHKDLCQRLGISSYPTLRVYPLGSKGAGLFRTFNGWNRDSESLKMWVRKFLPSFSKSLTSKQFFEDVLLSSGPWVVDFYAPWCGHCQMFEPTFEEIARKLNGKVKAGKVDCDMHAAACQQAGIDAYPTLKFYPGSKDGKTQIPWGEQINSQYEEEIVDFLQKKIKIPKVSNEKDEL